MNNKGANLEKFIHFVYSSLLNLQNNMALVSKNVNIVGKSGASHEFDIFYEFYMANIKHRVAIECKNHSRPICKGYVTEFGGKLGDVENLVGVMISMNGFQSGAKVFAKHYGISLLTLDDLPSFNEVFALQIREKFLPNATIVGEPFWTIMELNNGNITGSYYCLPKLNYRNYKMIPLFFSKKHALQFCEQNKSVSYVVRGLNQRQLRAMLIMSEAQPIDFLCIYSVPLDGSLEWGGVIMTHEDIKDEYLVIKYI